MKLPFMVNKWQYIAWLEGLLLERNEKGEVFAVDEIKCQEAQDRLEKGEEVYLTQGHEIVSKMILDKKNKCIKELPVEDEIVLK